MSDAEYAALVATIEELHREYNTPELATKLLQEHGIVDADGQLAGPYRDPSYWE